MKAWKDTQPFALAAAGYFWKNPPGDRAARLVETVGLRGKRVHGAEISTKRGNLIVNRGGATHADVLARMEVTREAWRRGSASRSSPTSGCWASALPPPSRPRRWS